MDAVIRNRPANMALTNGLDTVIVGVMVPAAPPGGMWNAVPAVTVPPLGRSSVKSAVQMRTVSFEDWLMVASRIVAIVTPYISA
jgi:hypothetical protein